MDSLRSFGRVTADVVTAVPLVLVLACGSNGSTSPPPVPTAIALVSGSGQTGPAGQVLAQPLVVKVTTASGAGDRGATVTWTTAGGSGALSGSTTTTDAQGRGSVTWTLGREPGAQTATATSTGLTGSPVTFTASATPNGTITGTITLSGGFLSPPQRTPSALRKLATALGTRPGAGTTSLPPPALARSWAVPNELLVQFRPSALNAPRLGSSALAAPLTVTAVNAGIRSHLALFAAATRAAVTGVSPVILTARVQVPRPEALDSFANALRADPAVAVVERNLIVGIADRVPRDPPPPARTATSAASPTTPDDPLYPWQAWHYEAIDLPRAWSITTGSASVLVAVVDKGIRFDHPA